MIVHGSWPIAAAFVLAALATKAVHALALRSGLMDHPSERSSHTLPTPRGGGAAIVAAFFASLLWLLIRGQFDAVRAALLLLGGTAVAGVGLLDDRYTLPAPARLIVHLAAATAAVALIGAVTFGAGSAPTAAGIWAARLFSVIAMVWAINLFNFMDGIDGIAASEAVFVAGAGAGLYWLVGGDPALSTAMLCLAAASAGFLLWNWPPASIFMGDVGSGFLGFVLAALGLMAVQNDAIPMEVWPILGGVFLVDATVTLIRRVAHGHRWHEAHRMHAYQHLALRWRKHLPVTLAVNLINVLWLLPCATYAALTPARAPLSMAVALLPLMALALISGAGKP